MASQRPTQVREKQGRPLEVFKRRLEFGHYAWEGGEYESALEIFEDLLEEHPDFPDLHNSIGLSRAMLDDRESALRAFERANELAPHYAEAHFNRGAMLNELGRHDDAGAAFVEAVRLDRQDGTIPSDVGNRIANLHADLGDLYVRVGEFQRAVEQYRLALDVRPHYPDVRSRLAEALLRLCRWDEARAEFEAALAINDGLVEARIRLGVVLRVLGDVEGAVLAWRRARRDDPADSRPAAYLAGVGASMEEPAKDAGAAAPASGRSRAPGKNGPPSN